jgi:hypothetical protein
MMDSTCLLGSKSHSSPDDGQYVPSQVKIIEFQDDGQYVPSHVKIIELPITSADDGEYMPITVKII